MAKVLIPTPPAAIHGAKQDAVTVSGRHTVGEVLSALTSQYPDLQQTDLHR